MGHMNHVIPDCFMTGSLYWPFKKIPINLLTKQTNEGEMNTDHVFWLFD